MTSARPSSSTAAEAERSGSQLTLLAPLSYSFAVSARRPGTYLMPLATPPDHGLRWQLALLRLFEGKRVGQDAVLLELAPASPGFGQLARLAGFASRDDGDSEGTEADIVVAWRFEASLREPLRKALREGSSFLFASELSAAELQKLLRLTFGRDLAIMSPDGSPRRLGLARVGGLLPDDERLAALIAGHLLPDDGERRRLGAELGWVYAAHGQLLALERLLAAGVRKEEDPALRGALLLARGELAQALPLLAQAVARDPLLGPWPWLAAGRELQLRGQLVDASLAESLHREREAAVRAELARVQEQLAQARGTVEKIEHSAMWRLRRGLGRGVDRAVAMMPLGREAAVGVDILRTQGPLATLDAVRSHFRYRLRARTDAAQRELTRMRRLARARRIASALKLGSPTPEALVSPQPQPQPAPPLDAAALGEGALGLYRALPLLSVVVVPGPEPGRVADGVRQVLAQSYPSLEVIAVAGEPSELAGLLELPAVRLLPGSFQAQSEILRAAHQVARGMLFTWVEAGSPLAAHDLAQLVDALLRQPASTRVEHAGRTVSLRSLAAKQPTAPLAHALPEKTRQLARAARTLPAARHLLPSSAGERPLIGCHLRLDDPLFPVDKVRLRRLMADNPWAFFVLLHSGPGDAATAAAQLLDQLDNAAFLGTHALGEPLLIYSCLDWLLLPPGGDYAESLAVAYSIGRPLVLCEPMEVLPAPYQLQGQVLRGQGSLDFCRYFPRTALEPALLDAYLDTWTPPQQAPIAAAEATHERPLKATLLIDTLDVGGMEEVVAFLANNLGALAIQPSVVCFQSGGHVAERLKQQGHPVLVAGGDPERLAMQLRSQAPDVINTHLASLPALRVASTLGRPIVETIHNTYVWMSDSQWQEEQQRSGYFAAALAVSDLVRRYYKAHNPQLPAKRITVAGNAIDPARLAPLPMAAARKLLGLPPVEEATLFVVLGRYCYQKNQLGILRAFAEVAERDARVHLLIAGSFIGEEVYHQLVERVRASLPCAQRVRMEPFRSDVSTLLSAADALILDSYYEGWSLAGTEALLLGTPLIHSLCGSAEELCCPGSGAGSGILIPNPGGDIMRLSLARIHETAVRTAQPNRAALVAAMSRIAGERLVWLGRRDAIAAGARRMFHPTAVLHRYAQAFRSTTSHPLT